ncbi:MAG: DUF2975 domain-containing protein [Oscillospiraceae bacterium]|nr:DUF2975 domain-containing protein [Oscillospiraceae bacterium]
MDKNNRSIILSLFLCYLFLVILAILTVAAPFIVTWYVTYFGRPEALILVALVAFYSCFIPAVVALILLVKLLKNIQLDKIFIKDNSRFISHISVCCFIVAVICFASGFFYMPFFMVFIAAWFMGIILRVIKNVFVAANEIKDENELTI